MKDLKTVYVNFETFPFQSSPFDKPTDICTPRSKVMGQRQKEMAEKRKAKLLQLRKIKP